MRGRILVLSAALAVGAMSIGVVHASSAVAGCADDSSFPGGVHPGGEWPSPGGDLQQTRNQADEHTINASNVGNLKQAWVFDTGGFGSFQNTPAEADGCVFAATSTGYVFKMDADTGKSVVRSLKLPGSAAGSLQGGVITGSPVIKDGVVYVGVAEYYTGPPEYDTDGSLKDMHGPFVAALSESDLSVLWLQPTIDPAKGKGDYRTTIVAAPVVWDGLIFQGMMGDESAAGSRGGYAILDANSGALIDQEWTIPDAEYDAGYRGASIWSNSALDPTTGYVYSGGGNPASKQQESRYSDSILKIDVARARDLDGNPIESPVIVNPRFGKIVGAYKGLEDHYYPGLDRQPACEQVPTTVVWSPTCVQLDLDFGATPSVFTTKVGAKSVTLVGDLQKAGIYHAAFADTMEAAWTQVVGAPAPTFNAASPAVDGNQVYVVGTPPAQAFGLDAARGTYNWVSPIATGPTHYQPTSVANGVVYTMDNIGDLIAIDASTGLPMLRHNLAQDVGGSAEDASSQGVAIARDTVYAASSSFIVAFRI